jgi:ketosteroid isomerase-like protein
MKKSTFLLLPFFLLLSSCQSSNQAAEEAAVKAVIERETEMFGALDIEKWSATRTQSENTLTIGAGTDSITITRGWQKELAATTAMFKDLAKNAKIQVERTNWNVRVSGNVAWATYDQLLSIPEFGMKDSRTTEIRCLEKTGDQWTISVLVYIPTQ